VKSVRPAGVNSGSKKLAKPGGFGNRSNIRTHQRAINNRECLDHYVVWGETHLRRILRTYACYYNDIRTHWALDKDAPAFRPIQRTGIINSHAILGGLHHHYIRI